jgi:hypothetical protein
MTVFRSRTLELSAPAKPAGRQPLDLAPGCQRDGRQLGLERRGQHAIALSRTGEQGAEDFVSVADVEALVA